jgi:hypothetical protein
MMNTRTICTLVLILAAATSAQSGVSGKASTVFRDKAEDVLDCLDSAFIVATKNDAVFYQQSLGCRSMLRRLERAAGTADERALVEALRDYQTKITASHIIGKDPDGMKEAREKAITAGGLRAPDAPGK